MSCSEREHSVPTLVKYTPRDIDNHMANWKVIALVSGNIEAVSGPAAQGRPGTHEWTVWEGPAADKAEALQCADHKSLSEGFGSGPLLIMNAMWV